MSEINELGVDKQLTRKVRKIAMTSEFETSEQQNSRTTRRVVVAAGAKLAYTVPIVAASLKVSTLGAFAAVTGAVTCQHSLPEDTEGCMGACQRSGPNGGGCGNLCEPICDVLCPNVPNSNDRECLDPRACLDSSFEACDFLFD